MVSLETLFGWRLFESEYKLHSTHEKKNGINDQHRHIEANFHSKVRLKKKIVKSLDVNAVEREWMGNGLVQNDIYTV